MKVNKINREQYHDLHILLPVALNKEFREVISQYNSFGNTNRKNMGFDITNMTELIRMLISDFLHEYHSNGSDANIELMKNLSLYREFEQKVVRDYNNDGMLPYTNRRVALWIQQTNPKGT